MADRRCPQCGRDHGDVDGLEVRFADGTTIRLSDEAAKSWYERETENGALRYLDPWQVSHGAPMPGEVCSICNKPVDDLWCRINNVLRHQGCREPSSVAIVQPVGACDGSGWVDEAGGRRACKGCRACC